ncbi:MAG: hypothetical protein RL173_2251 [Fibrobacterota bacterium]|jgi:hypothetical protein
MQRKLFSRWIAVGIATSLAFLAGCDLEDTTSVPTQPGDVPGSKAQIFAESEWGNQRSGTILADSADWFRLDLKSDSMYSITVDSQYNAGYIDLKVEVYGSAIYQVYATDGAAGGAKSARLVFKSPLTGSVRVRVSNPSGSAWGKYVATVRREDQYEKDATRADASVIGTNGIAQGHRISEPDTDWVKASTVVGEYYEVRSTSRLIDVDVYDASGSLMLSPLRFDLNGSDRIWGFTATAATSYIRVTPRADTTSEGVYSLKVAKIGDDSREPDDSLLAAKKINLSSLVDGVLLPYSDDWVKFSATRNKAYHLAVTSNETISFTVVDSVGNSFGSGSSLKPHAMVSTYTIPVYVRLFGTSSVASYTIKVTQSDTTLAPVDPIETETPTGPI